LGCHFDEVEIELPGPSQCFGQGPDADLLTIGADEAYFASADSIVDAGLAVVRRCYRRSLLMNAQKPPYAWLGP
jgi:hypothetical protein